MGFALDGGSSFSIFFASVAMVCVSFISMQLGLKLYINVYDNSALKNVNMFDNHGIY